MGVKKMREIKFRGFFKEDKEMFYFKHLNLDNFYKSNNVELMQYTGLLDKEGVEIYEGDICKVDDGDNIYEVIFYMGGFRLAVLPRKIRVYDIGSGLLKNIEVIETTYKFMDTAKQDAERKSEELANNVV